MSSIVRKGWHGWGVLILILLIQILWFFGLHGSKMIFLIAPGVFNIM